MASPAGSIANVVCNLCKFIFLDFLTVRPALEYFHLVGGREDGESTLTDIDSICCWPKPRRIAAAMASRFVVVERDNTAATTTINMVTDWLGGNRGEVFSWRVPRRRKLVHHF